MTAQRSSQFGPIWRVIRRILFTLVVAAGTLASAYTTFAGAKAMISGNRFVAIVLTTFFQGGLFLISHELAAARSQPRRTALLWFTWALFFSFSAYASVIGMIETQREQLKRAHDQSEVLRLWRDVGAEIARVKAQAAALVSGNETIRKEIAREGVARTETIAKGKKHSASRRKELGEELKTIIQAEKMLRDAPTLGPTPPDNTEDAMEEIHRVFDRIVRAHGAIPPKLQSQIPQPGLPQVEKFPANPQFALARGLRKLEFPYFAAVFFAALWDLLPLLFMLSTAPKMTLSERVRRGRRWWRDVKMAWREQHNAGAEVAGIRFSGLDTSPGIIRVYPGALVEDVKRELAPLVEALEREAEGTVEIRGLTDAYGHPLSDSAPLLDQLGDQRVILVSYVTSPAFAKRTRP